MARTYSDTPEPRYVERALEADNAGEVTAAKLAEKVEGSIGISADLNDAETKVVVEMDLTGAVASDVLRVNSNADDVEWSEVDTEVTEDSDNLVSSGAVFDAVNAVLPAITVEDAGKVLGVLADGTWGLITLS